MRRSLTFQQGEGYTGCVDTTLVSPDPNPHCTDLVVGVDCCDTNPLCDVPNVSCPDHGLIRFDDIFGFGANQILPGSTITSAFLTVIALPDPDVGISTCVHRMLLPWTCEDTWFDWDGDGVQADDIEAVSTPEACFGFGPPPTPGGPETIDVTASLQGWSDGKSNDGWVFLPGPESPFGWAFHSCEGLNSSDRPLLQVTFESPLCGDNMVNHPSEQCDGTDDKTCPGNCRPDCTCEPGTKIPTVSEWGLVVMTLLVLTAGTVVLMRRRRLTV